jgi:hypothetical protein
MERSPITIEFYTVVNDKTGEEFVVYTDTEIDEMKALEIADVEDMLKARNDAESVFDKNLEATKRQIDIRYDRMRKDYEAARAGAKLQTYNLVKPTFDEAFNARAAANRIDMEHVTNFLDSTEYR